MGCQKHRRKDGGEGPIVAETAKIRIGLEIVIVPPKLLIRLPEAWSVVELEKPPGNDGDNADDEKFNSSGGEQGAAAESKYKSVDEKYVTSPDDWCEPMANKLVAPEKKRFGDEDDCETNVAMRWQRTESVTRRRGDTEIFWRASGCGSAGVHYEQ